MSDFNTFKLGDVAFISAGGDKPKIFSDVITEKCNIPVFANGETNNGLQGFTDKAKILEPAVTVSARGTIGFAVLRKEPFFPIVRLLTLLPKKEILDIGFLFYFLKLYRQNGIGSSQAQLIAPEIANRNILLPELPTQQKIASVLSALDDKIELNNRINAELEAMAKTLYDYWFVQFDFPNSPPKEGWQNSKNFDGVVGYKSSGGKMVYNETLKREIPKGWEVKSLNGLVDFTRGISYTSSTINDKDGILMINLKSFNLNGTYRIDGLKYFTGKLNENKIINKNDLLIAITDVTREAEIIGKAILSPDFGNKTVCSCDVARIDILKNSFSKNYLRYLFNSNHYHNYIKHFASGTLVLHLDLNGILWYKDIIPPINLQNKFEDIVNEIDEKITNNLKQNQELSSLRDWLLPMLMNGQVKVG